MFWLDVQNARNFFPASGLRRAGGNDDVPAVDAGHAEIAFRTRREGRVFDAGQELGSSAPSWSRPTTACSARARRAPARRSARGRRWCPRDARAACRARRPCGTGRPLPPHRGHWRERPSRLVEPGTAIGVEDVLPTIVSIAGRHERHAPSEDALDLLRHLLCRGDHLVERLRDLVDACLLEESPRCRRARSRRAARERHRPCRRPSCLRDGGDEIARVELVVHEARHVA